MGHTKLYLLRHGETVENSKHILQGHMPGTLSSLGIRQAEEAAEGIKGLCIGAIVCSDLKRCKDTAEIVNRQLGLDIHYTALLRERDWGSVTGVVVGGPDKIEMPDDAETLGEVKARAAKFLDYVRDNYSGQTVLAVSHGFFCRCIQAVWLGVVIKDVQMMTNAETRLLELD